jgi:hypothetical protein
MDNILRKMHRAGYVSEGDLAHYQGAKLSFEKTAEVEPVVNVEEEEVHEEIDDIDDIDDIGEVEEPGDVEEGGEGR